MFCYLTNIVYLGCTLYYTVAAYNSVRRTGESLPLYHKLINVESRVFRMDKVCYEEKAHIISITYITQWLLHSISVTMSLLVSIMYFILIYDPVVDILGLTNVSRHILNSLFMVVEFSLNSVSVKFIHVIYCVALGIIYAIYTILFWFFVTPPDNYIYKVIDWDKQGDTFRLIAILICAVVCLKLILTAASKLKFYIISSSLPDMAHNHIPF